MAEITVDDVRNLLANMQGQVVSIDSIRSELQIAKGTKSFDTVRTIIFRLADKKIIRPMGRRGEYRVVRQVKPVIVHGSKRKPPVFIKFPRDFETGEELLFARDITIREGDMILISGQSNKGKTALCLNFAAENIDSRPVLMGNEYTTVDGEPNSRFLDRLDNMNWVEWYDDDGDKFTLLPVRSDYAEHVIANRINIIDWINIETGEHYMIGSIMEAIKREQGAGVSVVSIQKAEGALSGRGGQFTKDFADVEILLDARPNSDEIIMTLGKVKESSRRVAGRHFAYEIEGGVKICNFREVYKCNYCYGKGFVPRGKCSECNGLGFVEAKQ